MNRQDARVAPRFLLHGILGVYNYGCEAIVRGTVEILRAVWPNCDILYQSRRPAEDAAALDDCDVRIVAGMPPFQLPRRLLGGIMRRMHLPDQWRYRETLRWVKRTDCLISIGGDIFTLPAKPYPDRPVFPQVEFAEQVTALGKSFVLWGASVGPFEEWPPAVDKFVHLLRNVTLVTSREPLTLEYLQTLGLADRATLVADPAFLLVAKQPGDGVALPDNRRPTLAVNLSPLSARHTAGTAGIKDVQRHQAAILAKIIAALDVNILLVPHVICPQNPADDDYSYLADLKTLLGSASRQYVTLLPPTLGAIRTKGALSRCDGLIAARMHCGIAGVSSGVPTLFLSYSRKAIGMAQYVYGHDQWVLPLQEFTKQSAIAKVDDLLRNRAEIQQHLRGSLPRFQRDAMRAGQVLREVLSARERYSERS